MKDQFKEEVDADKESKKNKSKLMDDILSRPLELKTEVDEEPEIVKYPYKSKDGFVKDTIKRGFYEIKWLYDLIKENKLNCFILGGYVRYMVSPKKEPYKAGDVDVYSYSKDDFSKLMLLLRDYTLPDGEVIHMTIKHENDVSVTYKTAPDNHPLSVSPDIQLIKPLKQGAMVLEGDMKTVLENFDFSVARCGLVDEHTAMVDADFDYDERESLLRVKCIHCPISSVLRMNKYSRKGYFASPIEVVKLFIDWDNRDDEYRIKLVSMIDEFERDGLNKDDFEKLEAMMRID